MDYTFEQLKHKTVAELREIAKGIENEAVQGYTQMNKEHLVIAISKALGIKHEHHAGEARNYLEDCEPEHLKKISHRLTLITRRIQS